MAEGKEASISEESKSLLELAKKGKPLKFAMICKGTAVVSLVVFKKGSVEKRRKEAKEMGKGQFYFGAINGRGMDLQFTMARADGFESEPVKNSVLKAYLDEEAGMKCKPTFAIVDQLEAVLDEDDPLVRRFMELRGLVGTATLDNEAKPLVDKLLAEIPKLLDAEDAAAAMPKIEQLSDLVTNASSIPEPPPPPPAPPAPTADSGVATKLKEALSKLKPLLEQALLIQPQRKSELLTAIKAIKDCLENGQTAQAQDDLIKLGKELKSIVASAQTAPVPPSSPKSDPAKGSYEQLLPSVSELMTTAGTKAPEKLATFQKVMQLATSQAGKGDFASALAGLEKLKAALEKVVNQQAPADDLATSYQMRMDILEPQLLTVFGQMTGDTSKLRAVAEFAREKAASGDYVAAIKALDRLEPLVEQALATDAPKETDVIAKGLVAAMKTQLEAAKKSWDSAVLRAEGEVNKFRAAIAEEEPELSAALAVTMNIYRGRMDDLAAQAQKLDNELQSLAARAAVKQSLYLLGNEVEADELLTQLATHEKVQVDVVSPLLEALSKIDDLMSA